MIPADSGRLAADLQREEYDRGYAAGLRDGETTGFWKGYLDACKDAGIEDKEPMDYEEYMAPRSVNPEDWAPDTTENS